MNSKVIAIAVVIVLVAAGVGLFLALDRDDNGGRAVLDAELQVYGNANGDWKIDNADIDCIQDIISGEKEKTQYADSNGDGVINDGDIAQVRSLIDDTARYVWLVDGDGHDKKIDRNITRVAAEYYSNTELMLILGLKDKVVAVDNAPYQAKDFYFGKNSNVTNLVNMNSPDYEFVETLNLDVLLTFSYAGTVEKQEKLPTVDVIYLGMYRPNVEEPEKSEYFQGILKAGYIFGVVERAEAYMGWLLDIRDGIAGVTSNIAEADKPKVLMTNYSQSYLQSGNENTQWSVYTSIDPMGQALLLAGGHAVAKDILTAEQYAGNADRTLYGAKVGAESIVSADIDYAFGHCVKYTYGGTVVAGPDHGYIISDPKEMNEAYQIASGRDLVDLGQIYIIAGDFRNGASGCMLLAAYMAKILHPDLFENMDPLEYHQQYVEDWMGISGYDIRTDGVFISPSI
jgi:iron complex transport system substrate-binding protein